MFINKYYLRTDLISPLCIVSSYSVVFVPDTLHVSVEDSAVINTFPKDTYYCHVLKDLLAIIMMRVLDAQPI